MVEQEIKINLPKRLLEAFSSKIFFEIDIKLRAGRHICSDEIDYHNFIFEYFDELDVFYKRYGVELIKAPENFFYLRPKASSIFRRSILSELEMVVGKILCYLYMSPERIVNHGIFTTDDVYDEIKSLLSVDRIIKLIKPNSTGSDYDKEKLKEKIYKSLNRLKTMGIISTINQSKILDRFVINTSCFRFGADVRNSADMLLAQRRLIETGEAVTDESLKLEREAKELGIISYSDSDDVFENEFLENKDNNDE